MSKKIFVLGPEETDRDGLLQMVLQQNKHVLPKIAVARLPNLSKAGKLVREKRARFHLQFDRVWNRDSDLIVTGSLCYPTDQGFMPLFTPDTVRKYTPDLTILLEMDTRQHYLIPDYGVVTRKTDLTPVRIQQEFNRHYASMLLGPIMMIRVDKDDIKYSLKQLRATLLGALKEDK